MVAGIASGFSTVLVVRLTDDVEWQRNHRHDNEWRPFVLNGRKTSLRMLLEQRLSTGFDRGVKDYDGCFSSLFNSTSPHDEIYLRHLDNK